MTATEVNLDKIYSEMKRVRLELRSIEKSLNDLVDAMLPTEKMSSTEEKELREIDHEMQQGKCISLAAAKQKYGAKERAKISSGNFKQSA